MDKNKETTSIFDIKPTMSETLKVEQSRIFPQDMSKSTLKTIAHWRNIITALKKQVKMKINQGSDTIFICPVCKSHLRYIKEDKRINGTPYKVNAIPNYCQMCGQKLDNE